MIEPFTLSAFVPFLTVKIPFDIFVIAGCPNDSHEAIRAAKACMQGVVNDVCRRHRSINGLYIHPPWGQGKGKDRGQVTGFRG